MGKAIERDYERIIEMPEPISIKAEGDSIWGFGAEALIVTGLKIVVEQRRDEDMSCWSWVDVLVQHQPCEGLPYTDSGIEKTVNELLNQYLPQIEWDVKWTEQGMQDNLYASLDMNREFSDQELSDMSLKCVWDMYKDEDNSNAEK